MKLVGYIIVFIFLGCSSVALSQQCPQPTTTSENRSRARAFFEQGVEQYSNGHHASALEKFNCSYSLYPHKDTLFNMGRCNEKLGNLDAATENYRLYVSRYPSAPDIADIEMRIAKIPYSVPLAAPSHPSSSPWD